ncbi:MAG: glycosyltransferase [Calditrichaeota bacterium]|nr:MAG: glycosyltransferase [Calditrichota bacterium]
MKMTGIPKISVITVSYNVRDFLEQSLISINRALKGISSEIFVVDNASIDGSARMVKLKFPEVHLIESEKNLGFSGGNNLALSRAKGELIVLINPDTIVQEDTFIKLLHFFETCPDASAATCKILNPDGSFSIDCRHSVPTPLTALWKLVGLNKLFPKNKIFGKYNLTYLDENQINQVEAISGSFMMLKREIIKKVGLLDEDFFMYCEDIDYCHRINQAGGKIYYVPDSQIIHYKGESTKNHNLDYVITFNKSLYLFYKKHHQQKYIYPFKWLIFLGVILRGMVIFIRNNVKLYFPVIFDLILLNLVMVLVFYFRFELKSGFYWNDFFHQYIVINIMTTVAYFLSAMFFDVLNNYQYSILKIIKANFLTYTFVSALTFFFKQFGFSRMVVIISAICTTAFMVGWRIIFRYLGRHSTSSMLTREYFQKRTLIVGFDQEARKLIKKISERIQTDIKIIGIVSRTPADVGKDYMGIPVVTSLNKLYDYLLIKKIDLVVFCTQNISYELILQTMAGINNPHIEFKMAPGHLEFMIGKSSVERLDSIPLIDITYSYGRPFNRFAKRSFDLLVSGIMILFLMPLNLFVFWKWFKRPAVVNIYYGPTEVKPIRWTDAKGLTGFTRRLLLIFSGKLSFVGIPVVSDSSDSPYYECIPGITGLLQINNDKIQSDDQRRNYELHYLKNQNLFMDIEILFRALFKF